jgi:predicted DsbA family dithiol-disulfide isomerase
VDQVEKAGDRLAPEHEWAILSYCEPLDRSCMNTFKVVSDLVCPWCYIGKRRLEAALRELPADTEVSVSWHPFQLNPDMPFQGMVRSEYLIRKFGSLENCRARELQLMEVGKTLGLDFRLDLQSNIPNTLDAHRVIWLAGQEGVQDEVVEALFAAYFCEGVNLSNTENLIEVATSAGLEVDRLERLLVSDEGMAEVQSEEQEVKSLGISSVPLFIIQDRIAVSGAQPPEILLRAFEQTKEPDRKPRSGSRGNPRRNRELKGCKV